MGLFDFWQKKKKAAAAAEQMWTLLRQGINFEVPLSFSKDDVAIQAIVELQRQHPGVELRFYQSRGLVLGLFNKQDGGGLNVSDVAHSLLLRTGQLKHAEGKDLTIENFLAQHEAFLIGQGLDPKKQEAEAQEARMKREAMVVGEQGEKPAETPVVSENTVTEKTTEPTP